MTRSRLTRTMLLTLAALIPFSAACNRSQPDAASAPPAAEAISNHGTVQVAWETDLEAAFERARSEEKTVLVTFYADWCVWCKRMETTTFKDATVATMLTDRVIPVRMNVEKEGLEVSDAYGVQDLPTTVMLDQKGVEIGRITGYFPPSGFLERVESYLSQG